MRYANLAGKVFLLLLTGLILAFYPVFLVLFTDKHAQSDYVAGLVMVTIAFLIVTGVSAALMHSWRLPLWLTVPAILVLVEYSLRETQQVPYHVAVFAALVGGTAVGVGTGIWLSTPKSQGIRGPQES